MKHGKHRVDIFPIRNLPCGESGQRKTFYVLECKKPGCKHSLKLTPSAHNRLAIPVIVKLAMQKGWYADRTGYVLCPDHRPGTRLKNTPPMPPAARRAAFLRIRDEHMASASPIAVDQQRELRMQEIAEKHDHRKLVERASTDKRLMPHDHKVLNGLLIEIESNRSTHKRGDRGRLAESLGLKPWNVSESAKRLIKAGYLMRLPNSLRFVVNWTEIDKTAELAVADPAPIIEMEKEEHPMPDIAAQSPVSAPSSASGAEPPRQATREDNRRVRDKLDSVYDDGQGRYTKDWTDAKVAADLRVPRAWVTAIRSSLYGDDVNEAQAQQSKQLEELAARAERLEEDALGIAARAEALAKDARKLLG